MVAGIGGLGLAGGCGRALRAEPPPPFVPKYSREEAILRLRDSACAKALGQATLEPVSLQGYVEEGGQEVVLDVDVVLPPSPLRVVVRVRTALALDPGTGEVLNPSECEKNLLALIEGAQKAISRAEGSPEVKRFLVEHAQVQATFDPSIGPRGRLVFLGTLPDGTKVPFVYE